MNTPKFSVIIPTLNEEHFLPHLLTSLTHQTVKNFDVTVVDGASHDCTVKVARRFHEKLPNFAIIECDTSNVSMQRNAGARKSKADWLVFIDADSILLPNFFERIDSYIDQKHPKFFTTWLKADGEDPMDVIGGFLLNMSVEGAIFIERPWAPGPLTVVRRDVFEKAGGFDEGASFGEDHDLSMVIYEQGVPLQVLREILYIHSMRRFRKEGNRKVFERNAKALFRMLLTKRGPKHMPGFIGGGGMYTKKDLKSGKNALLSKKILQSARMIIHDLISY